MNKVNVLLVEDDLNLGEILNDYLSLKGYETTLARDGVEGEKAFKMNDNFDLCILDLMMPKKDGFSLAKDIREVNEDIPIIFLTAKSMQKDIIEGFTIGADDYITKPFSMEELLLRIQAILKRSKLSPSSFPEPFKIGKLTYYYTESKIETPLKTIKLTTKENELLKVFLENKNKLVTRKTALNKVWKDDGYFNARSMDVFMAKIRKHLTDDPNIKILTVHREGYKLVELDSDSE